MAWPLRVCGAQRYSTRFTRKIVMHGAQEDLRKNVLFKLQAASWTRRLSLIFHDLSRHHIHPLLDSRPVLNLEERKSDTDSTRIFAFLTFCRCLRELHVSAEACPRPHRTTPYLRIWPRNRTLFVSYVRPYIGGWIAYRGTLLRLEVESIRRGSSRAFLDLYSKRYCNMN